jgi:hypothetical protein
MAEKPRTAAVPLLLCVILAQAALAASWASFLAWHVPRPLRGLLPRPTDCTCSPLNALATTRPATGDHRSSAHALCGGRIWSQIKEKDVKTLTKKAKRQPTRKVKQQGTPRTRKAKRQSPRRPSKASSQESDDLEKYFGLGRKKDKTTRTATPGRRRGKKIQGKPAAGSMNKALLAECEAIRELLATVDQNDSLARHPIAVRCRKVYDGDGKGATYGRGAVVRLARELGLDKATVYGYAHVAEAWPTKAAFAAVCKRTGVEPGRKLSWWHFVLIAAVTDPARREELLQAALDNRWSVRKLRGECNAKPEGEDQTPKPPVTPTAAANKFAQQITRLENNAKISGQQLAYDVEEADSADLNADLLDDLKLVRKQVKAMADARLAELDKLITMVEGRLKNAVSAPDASADMQHSQADAQPTQANHGQIAEAVEAAA